jgi:hypothetical protein
MWRRNFGLECQIAQFVSRFIVADDYSGKNHFFSLFFELVIVDYIRRDPKGDGITGI